MRKLFLTFIAVCAMICAGSEEACAQGFLDKAAKGLKKLENAVDKEVKKVTGDQDNKKSNNKKSDSKKQNNKAADNQNSRNDQSGPAVKNSNKTCNNALEYIAAYKKDDSFDRNAQKPEITSDTKIIECDGIHDYYDFSDGMAYIVPKSGNPFFIDENGNKVFETDRKNFKSAFAHGYVLCKEEIQKTENSRTNKIDVYVLYDKTGKKVKVLENITEAGKFDESGVALVRHRESPCYRYIDTQGNLVFPDLWADYYAGEDRYTPFNDGLALIMSKIDYWNSRYGYRDAKGKIIIKPQFVLAEPFSDGAALVGVDGDKYDCKWQYIDTTGKPLFDTKFSKKPESFHFGYAIVYNKDGDPFVINKAGEKQTLPCKNIDKITYNDRADCYIVTTTGESEDSYYKTYLLDKNLDIITVVNGQYNEDDFFIVDKNGIKNGNYFVTNDGKIYGANVSYGGFDELQAPFSEGKVRISYDYKGKRTPGYMNDNGEIIVLFVESEF